jgi:hypothetical protein
LFHTLTSHAMLQDSLIPIDSTDANPEATPAGRPSLKERMAAARNSNDVADLLAAQCRQQQEAAERQEIQEAQARAAATKAAAAAKRKAQKAARDRQAPLARSKNLAAARDPAARHARADQALAQTAASKAATAPTAAQPVSERVAERARAQAMLQRVEPQYRTSAPPTRQRAGLAQLRHLAFNRWTLGLALLALALYVAAR